MQARYVLPLCAKGTLKHAQRPRNRPDRGISGNPVRFPAQPCEVGGCPLAQNRCTEIGAGPVKTVG